MPGWSTTQKGANVTISGTGNITATFASGTEMVAVDEVANASRMYIEMVLTTMPSTGRVGFGLNHLASGLTYTTVLGANTEFCGYQSDGTVKINNSTLSTIMTYTAGDNIGIAVDQLTQEVWFRKNGGNWNNDILANQNPDGAVGGISYATMTNAARGTPSPFSFWAQLTFTTSAVCTLKPASGDWTYSAPTGFTGVQASFAGSAVALPNLRAGLANPTMSHDHGDSAILLPNIRKIGVGRDRSVGGVVFGPASTKGVSGNVKIEGVNAVRLVRLYDRASGMLLAETMSDGSGNYSFPGFSKDKVVVIAFDDNDGHNAGRFTGVVPGP